MISTIWYYHTVRGEMGRLLVNQIWGLCVSVGVSEIFLRIREGNLLVCRMIDRSKGFLA